MHDIVCEHVPFVWLSVQIYPFICECVCVFSAQVSSPMLSHYGTHYPDVDLNGREIFSPETGDEMACPGLDRSEWLEGVQLWHRGNNRGFGTGSVFVLPASFLCFYSLQRVEKRTKLCNASGPIWSNIITVPLFLLIKLFPFNVLMNSWRHVTHIKFIQNNWNKWLHLFALL